MSAGRSSQRLSDSWPGAHAVRELATPCGSGMSSKPWLSSGSERELYSKESIVVEFPDMISTWWTSWTRHVLQSEKLARRQTHLPQHSDRNVV